MISLPSWHSLREHLIDPTTIFAALLAVAFFFLPTAGSLLQSNMLYLPGNKVAEETIGVSAVDFLDVRDADLSNDDLIDGLTTEGGILWTIVRVLKYILGAAFGLAFAIYTIALITSRGEDEKVNQFKGAVRYSLIGFLAIALAEPIANTFNVARDGGNFITNRDALLEALNNGGVSVLSAIQLIQYILGGVALLFMGVAAFQIIFGMGDEDQVTESRKTLKWSAIGLVLAASTTFIISAIAPAPGTEKFADFIEQVEMLPPQQQHAMMLELSRVASRATVLSYVKYFQVIVGAAAVFMLFLSGAKMVIASGNDDQIEKQKKMIPWIFLGLGIIMFSEVFVNIFFPLRADATIGIPGVEEMKTFAAQIGGITNFILTFLGIASVAALIVGALYVSTAVFNPDQAEKGKKIILAAAMGILLSISAFALVNTVLSGQAAPGGDTSIEIQ